MAPQNTKPVEIVDEFQSSTLTSRKEFLPIESRTLPNILEHIGNTPLVRLNKIPQSMGIKCQVLAKCEFYGPGGSHKDRIALKMIEDAEKSGILKPGGTIIEPTSGNTGIGIAIVAAVKGYKCIFTMTDKNSQEKVDTLAALGAKIIKTPGLPLDHPNSYISIARRLQKETPNSIMLDQYANPSNPAAHYVSTGVEILKQCNGQVDMIVVGAGTGGAITGLGRRMKESVLNCQVIGVDPEGSLLAEPQSINATETKAYEVEGIGHNDFTPANLDKTLVDKWYKSNDLESLQMARRLISEEGLLVGASSGSVMSCAMEAIRDAGLTEDQKCVILFPDSIRNYMTKFLTTNWMLEKNLMSETILENKNNYSWWNSTVGELKLRSPFTVTSDQQIRDVSALMQNNRLNQIPVVNDDGSICGVATLDGMITKMMDAQINGTEPISVVMNTKFKKVTPDVSLAKLAHVLQGGHFAILIGQDKKLTGIVTQMELTNFIFASQKKK